ncbi:MAG: hypothetical protein U1G07_00330 [Verrucomicrobiota bacterium]
MILAIVTAARNGLSSLTGILICRDILIFSMPGFLLLGGAYTFSQSAAFEGLDEEIQAYALFYGVASVALLVVMFFGLRRYLSIPWRSDLPSTRVRRSPFAVGVGVAVLAIATFYLLHGPSPLLLLPFDPHLSSIIRADIFNQRGVPSIVILGLNVVVQPAVYVLLFYYAVYCFDRPLTASRSTGLLALFTLSVFVVAYDAQKLPILQLAAFIGLIGWSRGGRMFLRTVIAALGVAAFCYTVSAMYLLDERVAASSEAWLDHPLTQRIIGQIYGHFMYFRFAPLLSLDLLAVTVPGYYILNSLVLHRPVVEQLDRQLMMLAMPGSETSGLMNTLFTGQAYVLFGDVGILLGPALVVLNLLVLTWMTRRYSRIRPLFTAFAAGYVPITLVQMTSNLAVFLSFRYPVYFGLVIGIFEVFHRLFCGTSVQKSVPRLSSR